MADAIEREQIINRQHPERNGYGMIQGEANDLIHRIEHLEHNQLRAQGVKIRNRMDRIRVIGSDKLYTHSPEDIVIEKMDREQINIAEERALNKVSKKCRDIYYLREMGLLHREIADILKSERSTITKNLSNIKKELKLELKPFYTGGEKK